MLYLFFLVSFIAEENLLCFEHITRLKRDIKAYLKSTNQQQGRPDIYRISNIGGNNKNNDDSAEDETAGLVQRKIAVNPADIWKKAGRLANQYIAEESASQVNISEIERQSLLKVIGAAKDLSALLTNLRSIRRTLFSLMECNDFVDLLEYSPFIRYADSKNHELMAAVAVTREMASRENSRSTDGSRSTG